MRELNIAIYFQAQLCKLSPSTANLLRLNKLCRKRLELIKQQNQTNFVD